MPQKDTIYSARLLSLRMEDTQAGLKGFDRETAQLCFQKMTVSGFAFDIDLLTCAQQNKRQIVQIPLEFNYDSEMSTLIFLNTPYS